MHTPLHTPRLKSGATLPLHAGHTTIERPLPTWLSSTNTVEAMDRFGLLEPGLHVGNYRVGDVLAQGKVVTVYAGLHVDSCSRVIVQVLEMEGMEPTARECALHNTRSAIGVNHPGLVKVLASGALDDGRPYAVLEWLEGQTLGARIEQGPIPFAAAIDIVCQIVAALEARRAHGLRGTIGADSVFLASGELWQAPSHSDAMPTVKLIDIGMTAGPDSDADEIRRLGALMFQTMIGSQVFATDRGALGGAPPDPAVAWPGIPPSLRRLLTGCMAQDTDAHPTLPEIRSTLAALEYGRRRGSTVERAEMTVALRKSSDWHATASLWAIAGIALAFVFAALFQAG